MIDEMEKFNPFRLLWRERGVDRSEGGEEIRTMKTSALISPENRSIRGVVARVRTRKGRSSNGFPPVFENADRSSFKPPPPRV